MSKQEKSAGAQHKRRPPHPLPLSPEDGGEGNKLIIAKGNDSPRPRLRGRGVRGEGVSSYPTNPHSDETHSGILYVVATPVGNLEDTTFRAVRILKEADVIAAEDSRRARILLSHYDIHTPLTGFFSARQKQQAPALIERMKGGESVALITESGTPGLSDPGHYLAAKAIEAGIPVVPIPGPSAALAAFMASGLDSYVFTFYGFMPPKGGKRRRALEAIAALPHPVILYESPHRLRRTLDDLNERLGPRRIVIAREITKIYEEFLFKTLPEAIEHFSQTEPRGEFVLIVMGPDKSCHSERSEESHLGDT